MSESELFVVRIWHQLASDFRASVRRVDEDETHHFSKPDEVVRFLRGAGPGANPDDTPPSGGPPAATPKECR